MYLLYMVVISFAAVVGPGTPYVANWLPHQQFKNRQKISSLSWKSRKQLTFSILLKIGQLKFKILRVWKKFIKKTRGIKKSGHEKETSQK
jgi:hypothetical protein